MPFCTVHALQLWLLITLVFRNSAVQVRKRREDMRWVAKVRHFGHVLGSQQAERRAAQQPNCTPKLFRKQVQRAYQRWFSTSGQRKAGQAAKRNAIRTKGNRLDNISAPTKAAVNNHLRSSAHSFDHLRQHS
eukprot:COSAG02_NODE_21390_length_790_cov_0.892909_1_plen_132_part_00